MVCMRVRSMWPILTWNNLWLILVGYILDTRCEKASWVPYPIWFYSEGNTSPSELRAFGIILVNILWQTVDLLTCNYLAMTLQEHISNIHMQRYTPTQSICITIIFYFIKKQHTHRWKWLKSNISTLVFDPWYRCDKRHQLSLSNSTLGDQNTTSNFNSSGFNSK